MPAMRKCRGCGADVPNNAPFGHCPKCLLELGFDPSPEALEAMATPSPVTAGARRFGEYELLDQIGRGGMGIIYKARQVTLNRLVALKMVRAAEFASPMLIQRFHLEAEAAANLHHPNIVPIYETGEHQGEHFFSMELVDGFGLDHYITTAGFCRQPKAEEIKGSVRARQEQMARLMSKVARAVDYAHQHGVLHRDLKPGNILLDRQGEPHLTDFGVAKVIGQSSHSLTMTGAIIGTPSYMAPEQAAGQSKRATTAADIYSLGAILYEMLTGQPPFRAHTPVETLKQVVEQEPKHPTTFKEGVDRDLATICMKCLEKEPQRRYGSAAALAEDLERWLRKEPILAQPVSPVGKVWRWCRREPIIASLVGIIGLCLVAVTIVSVVAYRHADARRLEEELAKLKIDDERRTIREYNRQLREAILDDLTELWDSPTENVVRIPWDRLRLLIGRSLPRPDTNAPSVRLVFGAYTHTRPSRMFERFYPLLAYLHTNVTTVPLHFDLKIYKGYSNAVNALVKGEIDFMRPGPASYVLARQRSAGISILANQLHGDRKPLINGVIFTHADTGITNLQQLRSKSFAFGDPESTFGNFASKAALVAAGIRSSDLLNWKHFRSHDEVVANVIDGTFHAGAANANVVDEAIKQGARLRILHRMQSVSFPWVVSSKMPTNLVSEISRSLQSLNEPAILINIDVDLTGFQLAQPQDYDEFEHEMEKAAAFEDR